MTQPSSSSRDIDVITMGRSSIDLYSNNPGAKFVDIKSFGAFVGGCPTNIAVGTRRLGLKSMLLTAVGADPVGEFVLHFLKKEGVDVSCVPVKQGRRTSAVVLGIEPPDKFPLVFYRDNCADIALTVEDVATLPFERAKFFLFTGTGLSQEPSRGATLSAIEKARSAGCRIVMDLDYRADQWTSLQAYGQFAVTAAKLSDLIIGTEEELKAGFLSDKVKVEIRDSQVSSPVIPGKAADAIAKALSLGVPAVVEKRGPQGGMVHLADGTRTDAKPFKVDVVNVLGAGDAFASGVLYGLCKGWDWKKTLRLANATGAIVVTRQACANDMATEREALAMVESQGGF